jgi:hypothetical protein
MSAPRWPEWLSARIGPNWVLARRSQRIIEFYGPDVVTLSKRQYDALAAAFERETLCDPHGGPNEPCKQLRAGALSMFRALEAIADAPMTSPAARQLARQAVEAVRP